MGHASEMIVAAGAGNASVSKRNSFQVDGSGWAGVLMANGCCTPIFFWSLLSSDECVWYGCRFFTVHRP
jgi:hypothetical protein